MDYSDELKARVQNQTEIKKAQIGGMFTHVEGQTIEKARSGIYANTPENKKLGRVGQKYGSKKEEIKGEGKGKMPNGFKMGDIVESKKDFDMPTSLVEVSGKIVGTVKGTTSVPLFLKVNIGKEVIEVNPNYFMKQEDSKVKYEINFSSDSMTYEVLKNGKLMDNYANKDAAIDYMKRQKVKDDNKKKEFTPELKWSKGGYSGEYARYKMGTIKRTEDGKNYMVKLGGGSKSGENLNASSLEDAISKIDKYTEDRAKK